MAREKIREFNAKTLLAKYISQYSPCKTTLSYKGILIDPTTNLSTLPKQYPWLLKEKLVVKPDQLFGKRKQYGLVLVNANFDKVQEFITTHRNKETTIGKAIDKLTHFLIEPFIPHDKEYYLAITSERDHDVIHFSPEGGFNIEERWKSVTTITIPPLTSLSQATLQKQLPSLPDKEKVIEFITGLYSLYVALDFTYLEINPFCFDKNDQIHLLDTVAQVDGCASFKHQEEWNALSFPQPFGNKPYPEEEYIAKLDAESGASLKLTILNPNGRIWNILSGGGASIIYLDTIVDSGRGQELANYGEYSGNPTTEESYQYARTILDLMTRKPHPKGKILFIAGAIANFTDVKETFKGIIRALEEVQDKLRTQHISIFVRRGGPNYEQGLQLIKETADKIHVPMEVYGPETPMVSIIPSALKKLQ